MLEIVIAYINQKFLNEDIFKGSQFFTLAQQVKENKTVEETQEVIFPAQYDSNDELKQINFDAKKGVGYHRLTSTVTSSTEDADESGCEDSLTIEYPLKVVFSANKDFLTTKNDSAFTDLKIAETIQNLLVVSGDRQLTSNLTASVVTISPTGYDIDKYSVWDAEYTNIDNKVKWDRVLISVDYTVSIEAPQHCFNDFDCTKVCIPTFNF